AGFSEGSGGFGFSELFSGEFCSAVWMAPCSLPFVRRRYVPSVCVFCVCLITVLDGCC
ncbi:hypothetical protein A2U01_0110611, partial [Trifolium medium]|nr:hypothetical protein [Trifolium medium]